MGNNHSFMIYVITLFLIRVNEQIDRSKKIKILTNKELPIFIQDHYQAIIIFSNINANQQAPFSFIDSIASKYYDSFEFALVKSPKEEIAIYENAIHLNSIRITNSTANILNWIDETLFPNYKTIINIDDLNNLFDSNQSFCFGVDFREELEAKPKKQTIYLVSNSLLSSYNISLNPDLYIYVPQNRQIIKYNHDLDLNVSIYHYTQFNQIQTKYVGFYILDTLDNDINEQAFGVLNRLDKTPEMKNLSLVAFPSDCSEDILSLSNMGSIEPPIFCIIDMDDPKFRRWIIAGNDLLNINKIIDTFLSIGTISPSIVSESIELTNDTAKQISGSEFLDKVINNDLEVVVLFTNDKCPKFKFFKPIYESVSQQFDQSQIHFHWINISKNDIPKNVYDHVGCQTILLWPKLKKNGDPIKYNGNMTFIDLISFVKDNASRDLTVSEFDLDEVKSKLAKTINEIRFGNQTNVIKV